MHSAAPPRLLLILAACALAALPATAQTTVEYGHMAAGAAAGSASLRKASPAASFRKLERALSDREVRASRSSLLAPSAAPSATVRDEPDALTVLRVDWGASEGPESGEAETFSNKVVSTPKPSADSPAQPPSPQARGLRRGMPVAEVLKILGNPAIRTAGLDGRGYDEKLLYRFPDGWRVMVFALRGRATAFLTSPAPKKPASMVLRAADSVVP